MVSCRFAVGCVLLCVVVTLSVMGATQEISLSTPVKQVGKYERVDLLIEVGRRYANPFDPCEVEINIVLTGPSDAPLVLPAFFGQDYERRDLPRDGRTVAWCYPRGAGSWKARFAPMALGPYTARAVLRDGLGEITSAPVTFECVASTSKGFVRAGKDDPRFLQFSEGQPFFAIGQNLAFIGEGSTSR